MKKPKRVLHPNNLPSRVPIWQAIITWLVLDRTQAAGWVWGAVGLFMVLWFVGSIVAICKETWVNHFNNEE